MNKENLWDNLLLLMEKNVDSHIFNSYLKETRQLDINDDKVVVEVSSKFHKDYLSKNLLPKIRANLQQLLNKDISVLFTIAKDNSPKITNTTIRKIPTQSKENKTKIDKYNSNLNPKYTFNNFVVGASNQFAHAACMAVSNRPAKTYNPLFIYSGAGLGKTHLLNAIGNKLLSEKPELSVLYVSGEKFTNDLIHSLQNGKMDNFRNKYRKIDVLLVDDVHFIAGKTATQEEFFHTFNTLHNAEKQIILTSDRPPKEINHLEERLKSRFQWGLISDIVPPDLEIREAILYKKADAEKIKIQPEVIHYIAKRIKHNIRELEGAFIKLIALSTLLNKEIDLQLARKAVKDMIKDNVKEGTNIEQIQHAVADYYGIEHKSLISKRRISEILIPRQVAMYIIKEITNSSTTEIGRAFGSKDHSTVIHAIEKIKNLRKMDKSLNNAIEKIIKDLSVDSL